MANQQIKRLFRRRPEIDEAEFELLQSRVLARLHGDGQTDPAAEALARAEPSDPTDPEPSGAATAPAADPDRPATNAVPIHSVSATTYELPDVVVGVMAETGDGIWSTPADTSMTTETMIEPDAVDEPAAVLAPEPSVEADSEPAAQIEGDHEPDSEPAAAIDADPGPSRPIPTRKPRSSPAARPSSEPVARKRSTHPSSAASPIAPVADMAVETSVPSPAVVTAPARSRPVRPRPARPAAAKVPPVAAGAPYCPYCALLLEPPPDASRRCPRCRERIIVKRVDGRAIYLTEASVLVFESERRRMANAGRWTRERTRWLRASVVVDADRDRLARLAAAPLSEEVVRASRALYVNTVERSFRTAKRERRWEDASRIMRDHAQVLFRLAGSPIPPPEDAVRAHSEGAAAALRGVAEMSREAELVSRRCCELCGADDGRTFKIATELRTRRLPHAGCPRGLCRCDWYLAVRDQPMVRRNLRRRARAGLAAPGRD